MVEKHKISLPWKHGVPFLRRQVVNKVTAAGDAEEMHQWVVGLKFY
jgi:hypothetical protein